jgi:hypothetical protein
MWSQVLLGTKQLLKKEPQSKVVEVVGTTKEGPAIGGPSATYAPPSRPSTTKHACVTTPGQRTPNVRVQ